MLKICYIYENEETAAMIKDEIEKNFNTPDMKIWGLDRKYIEYGDVAISFVKYPLKRLSTYSKFLKVYIENSLQEKLTLEQLESLSNLQQGYSSYINRSTTDIMQAVKTKHIETYSR